MKTKFGLKKLFLTFLILPMLGGVVSYSYTLASKTSLTINNLLTKNVNCASNNYSFNGPDIGHQSQYENSNIIANLFKNIESFFDYAKQDTWTYWTNDEKTNFLKAFPLITNPDNNVLNIGNFNKLMTNSGAGTNEMSFFDALKEYASTANLTPQIIDTDKFAYSTKDNTLSLTGAPLLDFRIISGTFMHWICPNIDDDHFSFGYNLDFLYPNQDVHPENIKAPVNTRIGMPLAKIINNLMQFIIKEISATQIVSNLLAFIPATEGKGVKITGVNDFFDVTVFKFFASFERDFEARNLALVNMRDFNVGLLYRYIHYDDWYGEDDKDHPDYKKQYGFYRRIINPNGEGILNFDNPITGLSTLIYDFNKYCKNILYSQPITTNTTAWGTLMHQGKDYDPSKVLGALNAFGSDILDKEFEGINDPSLITPADIATGDFPEQLLGVSKFSDYIIYKYQNFHDETHFEMANIYFNILAQAYYYNNKGDDTLGAIFPDQIFVINYIFILWIILPFIIIGVTGIVVYLTILFKAYVPINNQIKYIKKNIAKNKTIKYNKKVDSKDTY